MQIKIIGMTNLTHNNDQYQPGPRKSTRFINGNSTINNKDNSFVNQLKNFQKYQVIVEKQMLEKQIKLIQWRSKTQFPIVKILFYKVLPKKQLNQCSIIQVAIQNYSASLHTLSKLPLYQSLHFMKEAIIGFERLFDRFGSFDINSKMIFINKKNKCRVWMNENVTLSYPSKKLRSTKYLFKNQIGRLFEQKSHKSTLSVQFYQGFFAINKMVETIQYIQNFMEKHKMNSISSRNQINQSSKPKINHTNINQTIKKIPTFVRKFQPKPTIDTPSPNKSFDPTNYRKTLKLNRELSEKYIKNDKNSDNSEMEKSYSGTPKCLTPKSNIFSEKPYKQSKPYNFTSSSNKSIKSKPVSPQPQPLTLSPSLYSPSSLAQTNSQPIFQSFSTFQIQHQHKFEQMPEKGQKILKFRKLSTDEKLRQNTSKAKQKLLQNNPESKAKMTEYTSNNLNDLNDHSGDQVPIMRIKINEVSSPHPLPKRKGQFNMYQILESIKIIKNSTTNQKDQNNKNGMIKTLNNFAMDELRDTINSFYDGNDILSNDLKLDGISLQLLGHMGKQLRGTINISGQALMQQIYNKKG